MKCSHLLTGLLLASNLHAQVAWTGGPFGKVRENPILGADSAYTFFCPVQQQEVRWQRADVFNPAAVVKDGKIYLLYRAEDNPAAGIGGRTSRIGLASSEDGIHFTRFPRPVLFPDRDAFAGTDQPGGCEDPRVVYSDEGWYVMAYTAWNGKVARLSMAVSRDLMSWEKKGPAFAAAYNGKYRDIWSKSGSIITTLKEGQPVALRIGGRYWMYWGEQFINLAWSDDLLNWNPLEDGQGELLQIVKTRPGYFDSDLTECGPPAVLTDKGILLLYNGKNSVTDRASKDLPRGTYSVGQILFDPADPARVLSRSDTPFLRPSLPHEVTGQYAAGTTFAEGLVHFRGKWFLYYGTADSFVGLAVQ
jgi:predicted GH43/DUF377 family glycosyl hydrolase